MKSYRIIHSLAFLFLLISCLSEKSDNSSNKVKGIDYAFWEGKDEPWSLPEDSPIPNPPSDDLAMTIMSVNLKGGRHQNLSTSRAYILKSGSKTLSQIGQELAENENTGVRFSGWSPNGELAIIEKRFNSIENANWEEFNKRKNISGRTVDSYIYNFKNDSLTNISSNERVSNYNTGVIFWPNTNDKLAFTPIINGEKRPFSMNLDGSNKEDLSSLSGYIYGLNLSPDGTRLAFQKDYKLNIFDFITNTNIEINTNNEFNFMPVWSHDSNKLVFISGPSNKLNALYIVNSDGSNLKYLATRGGYEGAYPLIDIFDFHGGSSDVPKWSLDDQFIYYTRKIDNKVEIMKYSLEQNIAIRLTNSTAETINYNPTPGPDGNWIVFGQKKNSNRYLKIMTSNGKALQDYHLLDNGKGAFWYFWRNQ